MITLTKPITVSVQATQSITEVTVERFVDLPGQKVVRAFIKELNRPIVLWEKDAYTAIGDWTEAQANAKVKEVLDSGKY